MCNDSAFSSSIPYRLDSRFALRAVGRWRKGGVVQILFEGQVMETLSLPPGEWNIVAMLIDAGIRSAGPNWGSAFMAATELARGLYQRSRRGNSDPVNIPRFVLRLRTSIAKGIERHSDLIANPREWSRWLIEGHRFLGYRISLPPENLYLEILPERNVSG